MKPIKNNIMRDLIISLTAGPLLFTLVVIVSIYADDINSFLYKVARVFLK